MNNDDFMGMKSFYKLLATIVVPLGIFLYQDVADMFRDGFNPNHRAAQYTLTANEWATAKDFILVPEHNDIKYVDISDLKTGITTPEGTPIMFQLANNGDSNDFPSIKVTLQNSAGDTTRELIFAPADYAHPGKFEKHPIKLMLKLSPGEANFTVRPFYEVHS